MVDFFLDLRDDILDFIDNNRKKIIIALIVIIVVLALVFFAIIKFASVKITITNINPDFVKVVGTKAETLSFSASATKNGKNVNYTNYTWKVSAGTVKVDENGIATWKLPSDEGTYSISASCEDSVGTKYITVIGSDLSNVYKMSDYKILLQDTDGDGLTDLYEASYSKTATNEKDTDKDGLYDGDELIMELNPLQPDSKGDGLTDGERKLEYTFKNSNVTLSMTGKGNFTRTSVDKYETETLSNVPYVLDGVYSIYSEAKLDDAKVTIRYPKYDIADKGLSENSLAVYVLDDTNNSFSKIPSELDVNASTLVFTTNKFEKYFIADSSKLTSNLATELVFVIDNSGSMYSKDEYSNSEENDPTFKRVDVINDLIDKLKGNYKFGAGKFTYDYTELSKLTSDKDTVKNRVSTIKTVAESFTGTYLGRGIKGGMSLFTSGDVLNRRYMIVLSDGVDTKGNDYDEQLLKDQVQFAKSNGIKIYTIGLGNSIDAEKLKDISNQTNGKYYFAPTADDLVDIFNLIAAELNYNSYDTTGDNVDDSIIIADSGFIVKRDGFSFSNFSNSQVESGYGYGMVLFAKMFYEENLPASLGTKRVSLSDDVVIEAPAANPSSLTGNVSSLRSFLPEAIGYISDIPDDFWLNSSDGVLRINSKYKTNLQSSGFTFYNVKYSDSNAGFKQYETYRMNVDNILLNQKSDIRLDTSDVNTIKVLSRLDITKYRDDKFYFYDNNDTAFERLSNTLNSKKTVMVRINDDYTVLAVKLLADPNNMNKYKIEVYDPNFAGVNKYIEVERFKYSDITDISKVITDKFEYKFTYQGVNVGICLSFPNVEENK